MADELDMLLDDADPELDALLDDAESTPESASLLPEIPATDSDIPEQVAGSIGAFAESIRPPKIIADPIEKAAVHAASYLTGGDPEKELERRKQEEAMRKAEYPIASTLGEISGELSAPFSKATGPAGTALRAGQSGIMGAAHGDTLEEAAEIGAIGAGATVALESLGPLGKIAGKLTKPLTSKMSDASAGAAVRALGDEGKKLYELDKARAIRLGHYLTNNNLIKTNAIKKMGQINRDSEVLNKRIDNIYKSLSDKGAGIQKSDLANRLKDQSRKVESDTGLEQLGKAFKKQGDTISKESTKASNQYKVLQDRLNKKKEELTKLREGAVSSKITEVDELTDVNRLTRADVDKLGVTDTTSLTETPAKTLAKRLQKSQESLTDTSKSLGDIASKESVKATSTVKDIAAKEKRLMEEVDDLTNQSEAVLANIDNLDTYMPLEKVRTMRSKVDSMAKDTRDPYLKEVGDFLRSIEDDIALQAEKAAGKMSGLAKEAKTDYSDLKEVERLVTNQPKEKADAIASAATRAGVYGAARGDMVGSVTAAGISAVDFLARNKDKFVASNLQGMLKNIKGNTKWAETFKRAMEKSGESGAGIASAHYQLMQTDEDYRKAHSKKKD